MSAVHDILPSGYTDEYYAEHKEDAEAALHDYQQWRQDVITTLGWKGEFANDPVPECMEPEFKDCYEANYTPRQAAEYFIQMALVS